MPYTIARHAGYCAGVRKAMELAFSAAREAREQGIPCYSLGELIHNPDAVKALRQEGVIPVERVEEAKSGMILLRSHGVPPQVEEQAREGVLNARTQGGVVVEVPGTPEQIGSFARAEITEARNFILRGKLISS